MDLEQLVALGTRVQREWTAKNCDEKLFSAVAEAVLRDWRYEGRFDLARLLKTMVDHPSLLPEVDDRFGDVSLKAFLGRGFFVQVLVWMDGSMDIHQHSFSGAFRVLEGSSVHSRYQFRAERSINSRFKIGRAELTDLEVLKRGDVRTIEAGGDLSHSLIHIERPSVTVVVRTHFEPWSAPQYGIDLPDVQVDGDGIGRDTTTTGLRRCLHVMQATGHPNLVQSLLELVSELDFVRLLSIAREVLPRLAEQDQQRVLEAMRERHGNLVEYLERVTVAQTRYANLKNLRFRFQEPDLRFFFALLAHAPTREQLYRLVKRRYPSCSEEDKVSSWIEYLIAHDAFPVRAQGSGIASIVRRMLHGQDLQQLLNGLGDRYGADVMEANTERVARTFEDLKAVPELAVLFVPPHR